MFLKIFYWMSGKRHQCNIKIWTCICPSILNISNINVSYSSTTGVTPNIGTTKETESITSQGELPMAS